LLIYLKCIRRILKIINKINNVTDKYDLSLIEIVKNKEIILIIYF